ncbi:AP-4 complex accessory subunit RUSC2 [Heptranchias perlo]|uniref:AP-4 complex accessory subunit RUSC2 n=1 Tax=Heptranchias perlo TaxID=212740 RepID=UPI00355A426B
MTFADAPISTGRGPERPPLRPGGKATSEGPAVRNITSFHELARKRRQIAAGHWPSKVKEDKSDWLMVFSPDTELPPPPITLTQEQGVAGPQPQASGKAWSQQKEVVTFRELRYRSQVDRWSLPSGRSDAPGTSDATRASTQRERHREPRRSEAGGQGPRPAGVKVSEEEEDGGRPVNHKSRSGQAREVSDGPGTKQLRMQSLFNKVQGCNAGGQTRDLEGSQATGDLPLTKGFSRSGQAEGQAEEAAHIVGGSGRARGKADGRDKSVKEAFTSLFPKHQRPQTLQLQPFFLCLSADRSPLRSRFFHNSDPAGHSPVSTAASSITAHPRPPPPPPAHALPPILPTQPYHQELQTRDQVHPPSQTVPSLDASRVVSPLTQHCATKSGDAASRYLGPQLPLGLYFGIISPNPYPRTRLETCSRRNDRWNCQGSEVKGEGFSIWNVGLGRSHSFPGRSRTEWCGMAGSATTPSLHKPFLGGSVPSVSPQHKKVPWGRAEQPRDVTSNLAPGPCPVQSRRGLSLWSGLPVTPTQLTLLEEELGSSPQCPRPTFNSQKHHQKQITRSFVHCRRAQLGDSRANPSVGHLVLGDLCPALYAVLRDGLKPYQQDLIVGRRPNSPWCVVEASVKAGPSTKILYSLYCKIYQLSQLSNSEKKFNAFVFGLLNLKHLDFWISHLQGCTEVVRTHYTPTAFLSLSRGSCRALFEELLLLLQPLSVFTFHLDPLFEYHHQFLAGQRCVGSDPGLQGLVQEERGPPGPLGKQELENGHPGAQNGQLTAGGASNQREEFRKGANQKPLARGASNEAQEVNHQGQAKVEEPKNGDAEPAEGVKVNGQQIAKRELDYQGGMDELGYTLQQTFDQVVQWGDRLAQTLVELKKPPAVPEQRPRPLETALGEKRRFSWWEQLGQSSQVYLSPHQKGSAFAKWMKPKTASLKTNTLFELIRRDPAAAKSPTAQDCSGKVNNPGSPLQNSEGEGLNTNSTDPIGPFSQKDSANGSDDGQGDPTLCSGDPSDQPEEGGPPKASRDHRPGSLTSDPRTEGLDRTPLLKLGDRLWLGRLFGAKVPSTYSPDDQPRQEAKPHRGRLPSNWLQVNINPFNQLLRSSPVGKDRLPQAPEIITQSQEPSKSARMVRTLCDHTATDKDHLSFKRGETLEIVACVDEDWIRCCHGDTSGLVPIGYTSLI